jgi:hypothetical protein
MAEKKTSPAPALKFNGQPITEVDAKAALTKIYGEKRVPEILAGLADGTYKCASVEGGHLTLVKDPA